MSGDCIADAAALSLVSAGDGTELPAALLFPSSQIISARIAAMGIDSCWGIDDAVGS